jgi:hypothetical protein
VHEQGKERPPKAEALPEHIEREQADEQHKQDARNTRHPKQNLFEGFIHGVLQLYDNMPIPAIQIIPPGEPPATEASPLRTYTQLIFIQKENKMSTEAKGNEQEVRKSKTSYRGGASDAVYGFGLIGAWVYYLTHATTFWMGVLGLLKGIIWPAMLVYELLKFLNM